MNSTSTATREPLSGTETQAPRVRVLCLGNELLADDSLGAAVAEAMRGLASPEVEILHTPESGFHLLDYVLGARSLVVIDTVISGAAPPGTIHVFREDDLRTAPGGSPHAVGLQETLAVARALGLQVPENTVIFAVEAADCSTLGGAMHPAVRAAIPQLVSMVREVNGATT